jgi:hypothetical protein
MTAEVIAFRPKVEPSFDEDQRIEHIQRISPQLSARMADWARDLAHGNSAWRSLAGRTANRSFRLTRGRRPIRCSSRAKSRLPGAVFRQVANLCDRPPATFIG